MADLLSWLGGQMGGVNKNQKPNPVNNQPPQRPQAPQRPQQRSQQQRPAPRQPLLAPIQAATVAMPKPPQSTQPNHTLQQLEEAAKSIVLGSESTGQKVLNTAGAAAAGLVGAGQAGFHLATGNRKAAEADNTAALVRVNQYLNRKTVTGDQGAFITSDQAAGKGGVLNDFVKPVLNTAAEVAPYVIPGGGVVRTGGLPLKVASGAGINAAVSGGTSALSQLVNTGKVDPGQTAKATLLGGVIGGAAPFVGSTINKFRKPEVSAPQMRPESKAPQTPVAPQLLPPKSEQSVGTVTPSPRQEFSTSALPNGTPVAPPSQLDTNSYMKQQFKAQETARKAGTDSKLTDLKNSVSTKLIDSLSPIENTLKQANKDGAGIKIGDANHITPQLDRAIRADTIAGQYIKDNGLADIIQKAPNTKALDQYLIARHAADLEAQGVKTGRNLAADKQLVKDLAPTYEPHAKAVTAYNQKLLDKTVEYGLISKETAAQLKKQYPNYVPANRIFGDGETNTFKGNGGGKASISTQSVVQRIKGSTRQIESPLSSIAAKTQDVIKQGERNKAAAILASYKDLPGNPFNLRELKPTETVGTKSTIAFLDKGKTRRFETTPEIESAAKSLSKEQLNILAKLVRIPTRALRLGATGVNVGFAMANVAKDLMSAAINSGHPFRTSIANPRVLGQATAAALDHNSRSYAELLREGAGGTSFDIARDAPVQNVARIRADKNIGTKALYTVRHPGELLRAVENTIGRSEEFTRALQYYGNKEAGLAKGMSADQATRYGAHAARNNTVNFARAGDYGAVLNSALPYLNAGVQGARTFVRNVHDRPVQTLTKVAVLSTLPAMTTTAWNLASPERKAAYDDISDYEKQGNIIIVPEHPVKDPVTNRWNVIKIPVSQEVANLNNIARNAVEAAAKDTNFDVGAVLADLIGTTTSINVQSGRQLEGQLTPQIVKPGMEALVNQNLFTGNQIVPDSQKNLPPQDQYGQYTSATAKLIGKTFGVSPYVYDNFVKTSFGGAGQTAVNLSDSALAGAGLASPADIQGKSLQDSVANRFIGAAGRPATDYVNKAYDKAKSQLLSSSAYKSLPQDEQSKALNRLQADVKAVEYKKYDAKSPDPRYPAKDLTANQLALAQGTRKPADYTVATPKKSSSSTSPADKYKAALDKFNADSSTMSDIQKYAAQGSLAKMKVGVPYSADVLNLYGMSKAAAYDYLTKHQNTDKLSQDLVAYDNAQYNAGLVKYRKYATGLAPATKKASGKKATKGKTAGAAKILATAKASNRLRVPKTTSLAKSVPKLPTYKKSTAKKFTVPKGKIPTLSKGIKVKRGIA